MSLLEGLALFRCPCAERLSVAGFSAVIGGFLLRRRFILRRRKAPFGPERPLLLYLPTKSVKRDSNNDGLTPGSREAGTQGGWEAPY